MGIIGVIWVILITLKLLGVAFIASWPVVIFWPLVPIVILAILALAFGVTVAGFASFRR